MSKSDKAATASVPTATLTFMYFSLASLKFVYQRDATANLTPAKQPSSSFPSAHVKFYPPLPTTEPHRARTACIFCGTDLVWYQGSNFGPLCHLNRRWQRLL